MADETVTLESVSTLEVLTTQITEAAVQVTSLEETSLGEQGPRGLTGLTGPAGGELYITALTALSGHRVITGFGGYASQNTNTALAVLGFIASAAIADDSVLVHNAGPLDWPAANLTPNLPLFLGIDGMVTQVPPSTGWLRSLGIALDADLISIEIGPAYFLGDE